MKCKATMGFGLWLAASFGVLVAGPDNGSFTVELNGREIHYSIRGKGPACMVLTNSWGLSQQGLHGLFAGLEDHFTMIYFDTRGMGGSGPVKEDADYSMAAVREDFDALRGHLQLDKVRVIGWSNGAMNLMVYAAEHSDHIEAAVFMHGVANITAQDIEYLQRERGAHFQKLGKFQGELFAGQQPDDEKNEQLKSFIIQEWFPELFADPEKGRARLPELYGNTQFSWRHMRYQNTVDMAGFDALPGLSKVNCRALVIAGRHDVLPPEKVGEAHRAIPNALFVVFEKSGHFSPIEEPGRFLKVICQFFNGS